MERWLRITENAHGEWSVLDLDRNYRVCAFNHLSHDGIHVHHGSSMLAVPLKSLEEAQEVVRAYAGRFERFDKESFGRC